MSAAVLFIPDVPDGVQPVGFHNELVLKSVLGLDEARIRTLYAAGAIGRWAEGRRGAGPPEGWKGEGSLE